MKKTILAASAVALLASFSAANAAETTGRIKLLDQADRLIALTNGQEFTYVANPGQANGVSMVDTFHVGERVRITHEGSAATGITALD
jgi:hypothetical protein